jgi:hypothetical protein
MAIDQEDKYLLNRMNGIARKTGLGDLIDAASGGGGGVDTLAAVGGSPNANGATIAGTTLTLQPASATQPGAVTATSQVIGGDKSLVGQIGVGSTAAPLTQLDVVRSADANTAIFKRGAAATDGALIVKALLSGESALVAAPAAELQGLVGDLSGVVPILLNPEGGDVYIGINGSRLFVPKTVTAGGTTGAQNIDKISGTVNFAAAATSLVVTNALVTADSIVMAVVRTNDATATIKNVVPAAGSFTINLEAAATAETSVGFFVIN